MTRAIVFLSLLLALPSTASADERKVFLNGLDLKNVEVGSREFENCTVRFDKNGNVHVTAPGFKVGTMKKGAKSPPAKPALTRHYYLINKGTADGKVQYDVTVYVNGKKIHTVKSGASEGAIDITEYLKAGANRVKLVARKNLGKDKKRRSYSPKDEMAVLVGTGGMEKGAIVIRKNLLSYERNASETGAFNDTFVVETE